MDHERSSDRKHRRDDMRRQTIRDEIFPAMQDLFDLICPVGIILGGLALIISGIRSIHAGWYLTVFLHTGMYLVSVVILLFRKRLSVGFIFSVLIGLMSIDVIHALFTFGLAGTGFTSLTVLCIFSGVFLGEKAGIIALIGGVLTAALIGTGVCAGSIVIDPAAVAHQQLPTAWIIQIALSVIYVLPLVLTVNMLHQKMAGAVCATLKISERLQAGIAMKEAAEKELKESEKKYRTIFEQAVEGIFQATTEGKFLSVNPSMAAMCGFESPHEMIEHINQTDYRLFANREDEIRLQRLLAEMGRVEGFETVLRRPDKGTLWVSANVGYVTGEGSARDCIEGTVENITKRKSAEIALQESEAQYRGVVENSLVAFYIIQDDRFKFVNNRFCALSGYSREQLVDKMRPEDLVHPGDFEKIRVAFAKRMAGEMLPMEYELRVIRNNGETLTIKLLGSGLFYRSRPAAMGTIIDITREKALELQLRCAQKMEAIGTLAGGIAHDFNNILTVLAGYGSLLQERIEETSHLRSYADHIVSAAMKASRLTQNLLTFSRMQPVSLKPINMNTLITGTEKLLKRLISEDIRLVTILSPMDLFVMADPTQIDQILFNLTTNARDAMPRGGVLYISTKEVALDGDFVLQHGFGETGQYALLSIRDSGTGMDKATMEKIFDPFFTTKEAGKGTGLGLSTVYGIVKQHDGYITVDSEPGRGTIFNVYLPLFEAQEEEASKAEARIKKGKETILLAEDNKDVRRFIKEILSEYGYSVIEAVDGIDAIREFEQHSEIALAVLDLVMPLKNGREAYNQMLKMKPEMMALFITGYSTDVILEKGIDNDGFDLLYKPLSSVKFLRKVREILDRT